MVGREVGEEGTRHLQGFVHFKMKKRLSGVKKFSCDRGHYLKARGSDMKNRRYCRKEGDVLLEGG